MKNNQDIGWKGGGGIYMAKDYLGAGAPEVL